MIEIVSATRLSESDFWKASALGNSLRRLAHDKRLVPRVSFGNRQGLPVVYNARLAATDGCELMVFVHDDVWLDDGFLADRVIDGLRQYDVIGIAGNRRRVAAQPGWAFINDRYTWDDRSNLSGCVAHGKHPFGPISFYGPVPADCELLDGVLLAARRMALTNAQVRFDARFDFHFYDLDFCRSARQAGLRLGTWPISLTHESGGAFGTPAWKAKYGLYLEKWQDHVTSA